ncbi:MAG TPA: PAS domain S-box protein [Nitrospiraceae bacterium]|nr:PAS domain S-box protein [Nitrospiraceae bacterium]
MNTKHDVTELERLRDRVVDLERRLTAYEKDSSIHETLMNHLQKSPSGEAGILPGVPHVAGAAGHEQREQALKSAELQRMRTEQALRESESRYARATAAAKVGVWELDVPGGVYHSDPNLKALCGYEDDELSTDPLDWLQLVHPEDQSMAADQWFRVAAGQSESYHCELRMIHKSGAVIWTEVRGQAVRDETGVVRSILGSTLDITDRRVTEAALREREELLRRSERDLRLILNTLPVGVCLTDGQGQIIVSNPAARQIWCGGTSLTNGPEERERWEDRIRQFPPYRCALERALTAGTASLNETMEVECLDGTPKKIRYSAVPVREETEAILGAIVVTEDLTQHTLLEEQAYLFRTLMDHSSDAVFICDPVTGRFLDVNASACRRLGYSREELLQLKTSDIQDRFPDGNSWPAATAAALAHAGSRTVTGRYRRKDGTTVPVEVNAGFVTVRGGDYIVAVARDISDRERAEKQLRHSEERFRTLIQCSSDMITILNPDATIRYKSPAFYRLFGYREEEILGKNVFTFFHPDDVERCIQIFRERVTTPGLTEPVVFGFRKADGGYLKLEAVGNNLLHDPAVRGIVVTCREVTGRIRAEEALRASEARLRALADHAPVSIFMADPAGQCMYVNQRWCEMTGYAASEAYGRGWLRTIAPGEPEFLKAPGKEEPSVPPVERETRFLTKSGTIRWAEASVVPLRNAQHDITGYICTSTDITERRRAQEELLKSHAFIRHIIDTDPNLIFAKDREGRYTLVNKAVADFYGTTVEALIGKTDAEFTANADEASTLRRQDLAVMDLLTDLYIPEETVTDRAGNRRWFQTVKRPLMDEHGIASHVLGAATDITARKKVEEALRQREQDLQAALAERERISEELHDGLLQSLYGVGLGLETCKALMKRDPNRATQPLERAVSQLNAVMREVRNFIAGLESELLQSGDLSKALRTVVESLADSQGLVFRVAIDAHAVRYITREQSLHVLNIVREAVSNGLRHSKADRGVVMVRQLKHAIRVTVRDNGIGFSPKSAMGVGHGLVNMAARARRIGGRLLIDSKPNRGTRIVFDLPKDSQYGRS